MIAGVPVERSRSWKIRFDASLRPDITIVLRMDITDRAVLDYYLLPFIDIAASKSAPGRGAWVSPAVCARARQSQCADADDSRALRDVTE